MSPLLQSVASGLRRELAKSTGMFLVELEGRIRQLPGNMVDGQVLPASQADALRVHVLEIVRREALPRLGQKPAEALRILDLLKAYGYMQLESERARFDAARDALFPAPPAPLTPEVVTIQSLAARMGSGCLAHSPSGNAYFAEKLRLDGVRLPEDLIAVYSAFDGFDLACEVAPYVPVFSLLPSSALDLSDVGHGYPRRAVVFQGGDCVDLGVGTDHKGVDWLVYEHDGVPIAKRPFELSALFAFALSRHAAPSVDDLDGPLAWETFFGD